MIKLIVSDLDEHCLTANNKSVIVHSVRSNKFKERDSSFDQYGTELF